LSSTTTDITSTETTTTAPLSSTISADITSTETTTTVSSSSTTTGITSTETITTIPSSSITTTDITTTETTTTTVPSTPTIIKDRCGPEFNNQKYHHNKCCSKYGWCGRTDEYCKISKGCQSEFGRCKDKKPNTTTSSSTRTIPTTTLILKDRCGPKFNNKKCHYNECCSKYGWCGRTDEYCKISKGCQSEFGECKNKKNILAHKISKNGQCVKKDGKCLFGECCSKYGYCGKSSEYCSKKKGCQSEFGKCW